MYQIAIVGKTTIGDKYKTFEEANLAKRQLLIKSVAARMTNEIMKNSTKVEPVSYEIVEV